MKALMVAIQPKWLKMILDGEKKFEFRNWKVPVGTVLYFYESKGKQCNIVKNKETCYDTDCKYAKSFEDELDCPFTIEGFEGRGKVVAKAVVEEVYKLELLKMEFVCYGNEPFEQYKYDGVICNNHKLISEIETSYRGYTDREYAIELDKVEAIEPKDVTEFVSWRQWDREVKRLVKLNPNFTREEIEIEVLNNRVEGMDYKMHFNGRTLLNVSQPPQSRTWVFVEEESK